MAVEYASKNTETMAASGWSGSGFAANATLVIGVPIGECEAGLDYSGVASIDYLKILPGATRGRIGGNGAGPLQVGASGASSDFVSNRGGVELHLQANGNATTTINNFDYGGKSLNYLEGGTFSNVTGDGGYVYVNESTVVTNFYAGASPQIAGSRPSSKFEYNATGFTAAKFTSGVHEVKRGGVIEVGGDAVVTIDITQGTEPLTSLTMNGGRVILKSAGESDTAGTDDIITTFVGNAGTLDVSQLSRPVDLGSDTCTIGFVKIMGSLDSLDLSNASYYGQYPVRQGVALA